MRGPEEIKNYVLLFGVVLLVAVAASRAYSHYFETSVLPNYVRSSDGKLEVVKDPTPAIMNYLAFGAAVAIAVYGSQLLLAIAILSRMRGRKFFAAAGVLLLVHATLGIVAMVQLLASLEESAKAVVRAIETGSYSLPIMTVVLEILMPIVYMTLAAAFVSIGGRSALYSDVRGPGYAAGLSAALTPVLTWLATCCYALSMIWLYLRLRRHSYPKRTVKLSRAGGKGRKKGG